MVNFSNTCELAYMYCVQGACKRPVVSSLHVRDYTLTHCWRGSSFSLAASNSTRTTRTTHSYDNAAAF